MKEKEGKGAKCGEIQKADSQKHHPKNYPPPNQSTAQPWAKAPLRPGEGSTARRGGNGSKATKTEPLSQCSNQRF